MEDEKIKGREIGEKRDEEIKRWTKEEGGRHKATACGKWKGEWKAGNVRQGREKKEKEREEEREWKG